MAKTMVFTRKPRNAKETEELRALMETLDTVAHNLSLPNWQALGYLVLVDIANQSVDSIRDLAALNRIAGDVVKKFDTRFRRRLEQVGSLKGATSASRKAGM